MFARCVRPRRSEHPLPDGERLVDGSRGRQNRQQDLTDLEPHGFRLVHERPRTVEHRYRARQRPSPARPAGGLEQEFGRPPRVTCLFGERGDLLTERVAEVRPIELQCDQCLAGDLDPLEREQLFEDRLSREGMPELEHCRLGAVRSHELCLDARTQCVSDRLDRRSQRRAEQFGVEALPEYCRDADHSRGSIIEFAHPPTNEFGEAFGHRRCTHRLDPPTAGGRRDRAVGDAGRQEFLHEERQTIGEVTDQGHDARIRQLGTETHRCHRRQLVPGEPSQLDSGRRPPRDEVAQDAAGVIRAFEPRGHHAQHRCGSHIVRHVLDHGCRVGIRPVQVLEHEHARIVSDGRQEAKQTLADLHRARPGRSPRPQRATRARSEPMPADRPTSRRRTRPA